MTTNKRVSYTEKAKDNDCVIENQDNSSNDIQGSEKENQQHAGAAAATTTANTVF
jgi:hypothetical protein